MSRAPATDRPGSPPDAPAWPVAPEWPADDERAEPSRPGTSRAAGDRAVLGLSVAVLLLSFAMVEVPGGRVALRGLDEYPLPSACASRNLLGVRCPGCGLTRSFIHLAEGDWRRSWRCHRLGAPMAAAVLFQIPYRLLSSRRPGGRRAASRWRAAIAAGLVALLLVNWLADVVTGRLASL